MVLAIRSSGQPDTIYRIGSLSYVSGCIDILGVARVVSKFGANLIKCQLSLTRAKSESAGCRPKRSARLSPLHKPTSHCLKRGRGRTARRRHHSNRPTRHSTPWRRSRRRDGLAAHGSGSCDGRGMVNRTIPTTNYWNHEWTHHRQVWYELKRKVPVICGPRTAQPSSAWCRTAFVDPKQSSSMDPVLSSGRWLRSSRALCHAASSGTQGNTSAP